MLAAFPGVIADQAPLTVQRIDATTGFQALREEWDGLLQASESPCVFLTWEWLYTWWKHLADQRCLSILTVRRGNELVAIAPLGVQRRSVARARPFAFLEFLGSGFVGSDYLDVIVRKGIGPEVCRALSSYLAPGCLPLKWTNLKRDESVAFAVVAGLTEQGWTATEATTNICPFIPLAGITWDTYLASLGQEHRYNFNRKWRRINRDYEVSFDRAYTQEQCREAIALLIAQHNARWLGRGGSDAFHTAGLIAFHQEWTQLALRRGWLRLYVLRLNEQPAACLYGFLYCGVFYFYQSSFDPAFMQCSVGLVSMGLAIRSAIAEGAREYDLLHGAETYKSHWSCHSRDLARLESFPPGGMSRFYRISLELGRASRELAHRLMLRGKAG